MILFTSNWKRIERCFACISPFLLNAFLLQFAATQACGQLTIPPPQPKSAWALDQVVTNSGYGGSMTAQALTPSQLNEEAFLLVTGDYVATACGSSWQASDLTGISSPWTYSLYPYNANWPNEIMPSGILPIPWMAQEAPFTYWDSDYSPIGATATASWASCVINNDWSTILALVKYVGDVPISSPLVAGTVTGTLPGASAGQAPQEALSGWSFSNNGKPTFLIGYATIGSSSENPVVNNFSISDAAGDTFQILATEQTSSGCTPAIPINPPFCFDVGTLSILFISPNYSNPTGIVNVTGGTGGGYIAAVALGTPVPIGALPTITSVSPKVWWAGSTQDITITGINFVPVATEYAGVSQVTVMTGSGPMNVSNVNVVSSTEITATVSPSEDSPAEKVTLTVTNPDPTTSDVVRVHAADAGPSPVGAGATVVGPGIANTTDIVLPVPVIQWNNNPISTDGSTTPPVQNAVVGQQIALTTTPTEVQLAQLFGLGLTMTATWTVDPTNVDPPNIGGWSPTTAASGTPSPTVLDQPNLTTYWVYPSNGNAISVTYQYCVSAPAIPNTCSTKVSAQFDVSGVTAPAINIGNEVAATIDFLTGCTTADGTTIVGGPTLVYGNLTGPYGSCGIARGTPGLTFFPNGTPPSVGNFLFAQIVTSDSIAYSGTSSKLTCTSTPGLDGAYPYQNNVNPVSTSDSPEVILLSTYATVTRNFNATMYLLWQSTSSENSVPVPLGYIPWTFNGTATNSGTTQAPLWTASGAGAPVASNGELINEGAIEEDVAIPDAGAANSAFVLADPSQANFGFPVWAGLAIPSAQCGATD